MYHQFNIQQFYVLPTQCIYVFCVDLRTNSDYFTVQHWLLGFYNGDEVCLLRGTDWIFKHNSGQPLSLAPYYHSHCLNLNVAGWLNHLTAGPQKALSRVWKPLTGISVPKDSKPNRSFSQSTQSFVPGLQSNPLYRPLCCSHSWWLYSCHLLIASIQNLWAAPWLCRLFADLPRPLMFIWDLWTTQCH